MAIDFLKKFAVKQRPFLVVYTGQRYVTILAVVYKKDHSGQVEILHFWQKPVVTERSPKELIKSQIELFIDKNNLKFYKILWVVPEENVILRRFSLPKLSGKELESALMLNVRRHLPCKVSDVVYGTKYIPKPDGYEVVFYGVLKSYISAFVPDTFQKGEVIFVPQDVTIVSLLKNSRPQLFGKVFCLTYRKESGYSLVLTDRIGNILFKTVPSDGDIRTEANLFLEYYKRTYKTAKKDADIPIFFIGEHVGKEKENANDWVLVQYKELLSKFGKKEGIVEDFGLCVGLGAAMFFGKVGLTINKDVAPIKVSVKRAYSLRKIQSKLSEFMDRVPDAVIWGILSVILGLGGLRALVVYAKYKRTKTKYNAAIKKLPHDVFSKPESVSEADILSKQAEYEGLANALNNYIRNKKGLSKVMNVISEEFGGNVWLNLPFTVSLDISSGKVSLGLSGGIYLGDEDEEVKMLEELIKKLRKKLGGYFSDIDLLYFRREASKDGTKEYLAFSLKCK